MAQQNKRLILEVNKLIGNAIIKDGGVHLPKIGSLSVVNPESATDSRKVEFSQEATQRSLVSIISEQGKCNPAKAKQVYNKWLEGVLKQDVSVATIEGIGTINNGSFTIDKALKSRLTPIIAGGDVPKKRSWVVVIGLAACCLIGVGVMGYIMLTDSVKIVNEKPQDVPVERVTEQPKEDAKSQKRVKTMAATTPKETVAKPTTTKKSRPEVVKTPYEPLNKALAAYNIDRPYKVISGVFEMPRNANRMVLTAESTSNKSRCSAYVVNELYFISIYDATTLQDALNFVSEHEGQFPEKLWIKQRYWY